MRKSLIQANVGAPCTVLDFPTLDRFISELQSFEYDVVGISSILPNIEKVKAMCRLVREYLPRATIVVGGHVANAPMLRGRLQWRFPVMPIKWVAACRQEA